MRINGPRIPREGGMLSQLDQQDFSWKAALGGWRGVIESTVPAGLFVILYVATRSLTASLIAAVLPALLFCAVRLFQRQSLTQALSGLFGVGIGVAWAAWSGRGEDYFAWGLVTATAFALVLTVSVLARKPAVGLGVQLVWELPSSWWADPYWRPLRGRATMLTWVWVAMFLLRLGVQYPLWAAGMVAELGVAKLVLGIPLFAFVAWVTWVGLRPFSALRAAKNADLAPSPEEKAGPAST